MPRSTPNSWWTEYKIVVKDADVAMEAARRGKYHSDIPTVIVQEAERMHAQAAIEDQHAKLKRLADGKAELKEATTIIRQG